MKKIFILLVLVLSVFGISCQHSSSSKSGSTVNIPILSSAGIGRSVMQDISSSTMSEDQILADCFYPIVTGWKQETIDVDLSSNGSYYQYQETAFDGKNVNITIEHFDAIVLPDGSSIDESKSSSGVYLYTGLIGSEYYGDWEAPLPVVDGAPQNSSLFQAYIWQDLNGKTHFVFVQVIGVQKFSPEGTLINEYYVIHEVNDTIINLVGDEIKTMTYDVTAGARAAFYKFDGTSNPGKEGFYFSDNCDTSRTEDSFTFTLKDVYNTTREGEIVFKENFDPELNVQRFIWPGYLKSVIYWYATNKPEELASGITELPKNDFYIPDVDWSFNDRITSKTFIKSFN